MTYKLLIALFGILYIAPRQGKIKTYYILDKGVYVKLDNNNKKIRVPFKENRDFYFSLKNDSIALIQDIYKGKPNEIKEYKISENYDTTYVNRYTIVKGKKKLDQNERIIFQKIY